MSSSGNARATVDDIIARTHTADFYLAKAQNEIDEIIQELLVLNLGGTNSSELQSATRVVPKASGDIETARMTIASTRSEMETYRRQL
jgi:hypothetical protein